MPIRTIILILVLTALTGILVVLAINNERQAATDTQPSRAVDITPTLEKTGVIEFTPATVVLASGSGRTTVDVSVDTKEHMVDGVQLELLYDPAVLSNVSITVPQDNFFGESGEFSNILNEVDSERGRVSYWLGISPIAQSKKGEGVIAQLSFTVNPNADVSQTAIEVLDRSMITETSTHTSILATPAPLNISIVR
jgi:hypothetical protein